MPHQTVTYSLVGRDDVHDPARPFRRLAFLPDGVVASEALARRHRADHVLIHDTGRADDPSLANRFWHVNYSEDGFGTTAAVLGTDDVLALLERERAVLVVAGPFDTHEAASRDLDLRWESHG